MSIIDYYWLLECLPQATPRSWRRASCQHGAQMAKNRLSFARRIPKGVHRGVSKALRLADFFYPFSFMFIHFSFILGLCLPFSDASNRFQPIQVYTHLLRRGALEALAPRPRTPRSRTARRRHSASRSGSGRSGRGRRPPGSGSQPRPRSAWQQGQWLGPVDAWPLLRIYCNGDKLQAWPVVRRFRYSRKEGCQPNALVLKDRGRKRWAVLGHTSSCWR